VGQRPGPLEVVVMLDPDFLARPAGAAHGPHGLQGQLADVVAAPPGGLGMGLCTGAGAGVRPVYGSGPGSSHTLLNLSRSANTGALL